MYKPQFIPPAEKTYEMPDELGTSEPRSVLILEDDGTLSNMLKDCLEANSYQVTQVTSGAEGIQKIMAQDFDVILCDMIMPGFPGDMFYRAVERARPHLCKRFIFMTGHKGDPKIDAFIRQIRGLMLWKPFQLQDVMDAIQTIIRKAASEKP